ncbi:MAG: AraC family transcriptional regulator [Gemmatimonadales bacterium]
MLQYLERHGVSSAEAAQAAGIVTRFPADADERVPGGQVERLWTVAIERTGDPLVGLHMTEAYSPGTLDILGYVILSCRTIGDVLERFARYAPLLNDGLRVELVRGNGTAYCRCTFVETMDNYLLRAPDQPVDTVWAALARELGRLAAAPLRASEIRFRRRTPPADQRAEFERVFAGVPLRFGAPEDRFYLPATHLAVPVLSANPALLRAFEQHAEASLASLGKNGTKSHQVAQVLARRIKGTVPPLADIARELAMSDRNLQRALKSEGTSFQKLLDEVRRDLAVRHLSNPSTSTGQVGFLLGFSEPSAFHRAFRRWTGKPPSAYRRAAMRA